MAVQSFEGLTPCPDCGQLSTGDDVHWKVCQSYKGLQRRIRADIEPGYLPITFSRIKRWEECAYGEQQENRIPDRVREHSEKADLGTAIHAILEARQRGEVVVPDRLAKLVSLDEASNYEFLERNAARLLIEDSRPHALFLEDEARLHWEFPVDLEDGSTVVAQVEVKQDALRIFTSEPLAQTEDYKTGRVVPTQSQLDKEGDDQGYLYCAVVSEQPFGQHIEWFDFFQHQIRFNRSISARWHRSVIEEFKERFKTKVAAYAREQQFDTRPGDHCHWCPVAHRCPQGSKLVAMGIVPAVAGAPTVAPTVATDEAAQQVALTVLQMKSAVAQLDGWLRERVKATGLNIALPDGTNYGSQIKYSLKLPKEKYAEARELLAEKGFDFNSYVRLDMDDGDGWKFIKGKRGPEAGLLKDLAEPEAYTRWEQSKKDE